VLYLKNRLYRLKLKPYMASYIAKLEDIRDRLVTTNKKIEDQEMVIVILNRFLRRCKHFVTSINITYKNCELSLEELDGMLLRDKNESHKFEDDGERTLLQKQRKKKSSNNEMYQSWYVNKIINGIRVDKDKILSTN
jgi:hypothetical protein